MLKRFRELTQGKKKLKLVYLSLVALGLLIVVLFGYLFIRNSDNFQSNLNQTLSLDFSAYAEEKEQWSKRIDEVGPDGAYEEFKEEYEDLDLGTQHSLVHVFGAILYEKEGVSGVVFCDSAFSFGCYHSFYGVAIAYGGTEALDLFDQACIEKYGDINLPCQHGIGHGVLSYYGYDGLLEALGACASITWQPIGGCSSGVFMEYNFRTMASFSGLQTRRLDPDHPHEPCSKLPEKYLQACYFEQPQWWETVYKGDYEKIGLLCNEVDSSVPRESCFQGVGNFAAPYSGFKVKETAKLCKKMPDSQSITQCVEGASWIYLTRPDKNDALLLCESLEGDPGKNCIHKVKQNPFFEAN